MNVKKYIFLVIIILAAIGLLLTLLPVFTEREEETTSDDTGYYFETEDSQEEITRADPISPTHYIGNRKSKKYHKPTCSFLPDAKNQVLFDTKADAEGNGYVSCQHCNP